jgi:predicted metal-dependent phosphoesterase TrpH
VREAKRAGLSTVALTDHDTIAGLEEAQATGEELCVRVIVGVEISTWRGVDLHLLAYGFDPTSADLREVLRRCRDGRRTRAERMVAVLARLGAPITMGSVERHAGEGAIGRPHVAKALVEAGHVSTIRKAFLEFLGEDRPAYVEKVRLDPGETIARVQAAGGVAVAAHPGIYGEPESFDPLVEAGLDGVEILHPLHGRKTRAAFDAYAIANGLARTGGSDFHGPRGTTPPIGRIAIEEAWIEDLRERIGRRREQARTIHE